MVRKQVYTSYENEDVYLTMLTEHDLWNYCRLFRVGSLMKNLSHKLQLLKFCWQK